MKFSLISKVLSAITILRSFHVLQAEAVPTNNQSFAQWCLQKNSLPTETRKTFEVILKETGTQDCKLANSNCNF